MMMLKLLKGGMMIINRVPELLKSKFGGKPNMLQIQRDTGLAYGTVSSWVKGEIDRVDFPVLEIWCKYLNCQPGDLLVYGNEKDAE